jgi:hypothetical protein
MAVFQSTNQRKLNEGREQRVYRVRVWVFGAGKRDCHITEAGAVSLFFVLICQSFSHYFNVHNTRISE